MIKYKHYDNDEQVDTDYEFWYDVDGERIGKCKRIRGSFSVPVVRGSSQETEEFTFYLRDEEGNVMSEFKSNFCPSKQTPFLSQTSFLAKENNFYFNGKIKATEKIEGYHNQTCPIWNFYHQDHLGNTRVITDDQGNVIAEHKYYPYGEELVSQTQDTLSHRFTSHERDFESNLDYMMARYYSSFQGRFLSPDPKKGGVERNSQKFNLYSYVINNPIRYTDPEGESLADIWQGIKDFWCAIFGCNEESKTDEDKEKEEKNEEEKKEEQDKTTEKQELYQEAGIEDTSRPPLTGTQSGFGPKANKELKEAGSKVVKEVTEEAAYYLVSVIVLKSAGKITGFTKHGLERVLGREGKGVSNKAILDAVKNPIKVIFQKNGNVKYTGRNAEVVLNKKGEIVTAWSLNKEGYRIK